MQKQVLITIGALISVVALVIAAQFFARTISVQSSSPTLTTVTRMVSTSISISGADRFEPNNGFDQATPIELGVEYGNLNFVEFTPSENSSDRDYFKTQIKQGMLITCRTFNLSPGTNTNLILYDQSQHGIIGNDDVNRATGDLSSSVTYLATYDGWLYIQVGEGVQRTLEEASRATYSMECTFNK